MKMNYFCKKLLIMNKGYISLDEMIAVVQNYIYFKKGVRISIILHPNPFTFQNQLDKLHYAYNIASDESNS
jgi:hypothetical protein